MNRKFTKECMRGYVISVCIGILAAGALCKPRSYAAETEEGTAKARLQHSSGQTADSQVRFCAETEKLSASCLKEEEAFSIEEIPEGGEVYDRIYGRSYRENDDISLEELRYLCILYYDFDHEVQEGELIVNEEIAEDCLEIFRELYEQEYEFASVKLIDEYWTGDATTTDSASIEANNTSAFCYRLTTSGRSLSNHALGYAIDINPRQNPYFDLSGKEPVWFHEGDEAYLDRTSGKEHMITEDDLCYQLFTEHGFTWGGSWSNPKDYQHFEYD